MDAFTFCIQQICIFVLILCVGVHGLSLGGGGSQELAAPVTVISPPVGVRVARSKVSLFLTPFYFCFRLSVAIGFSDLLEDPWGNAIDHCTQVKISMGVWL